MSHIALWKNHDDIKNILFSKQVIHCVHATTRNSKEWIDNHLRVQSSVFAKCQLKFDALYEEISFQLVKLDWKSAKSINNKRQHNNLTQLITSHDNIWICKFPEHAHKLERNPKKTRGGTPLVAIDVNQICSNGSNGSMPSNTKTIWYQQCDDNV